MGFGIFKKIGDGLKTAFGWVRDKIVKPVANFFAPVADEVSDVVETLVPGSKPVVELAKKGIKHLSGSGSGSGHG